MKFPIKSEDLLDLDVQSDEEATIIVIEAIVSDDFGSLVFADNSKSEELLTQTRQWEKFDEYVSQIEFQKQLLHSTIGDNSINESDTKDEDVAKVVADVTARLDVEKSDKNYRRLSFVASFLLFAVISSALSINMFNQSTEANFSGTTDIQGPRSQSLNDSNSGNSAESGDFSQSPVTDTINENSISTDSSITFSTIYDVGPTPTKTVFKSRILLSQLTENKNVQSNDPSIFAKVIEQFRSECVIPSGFVTNPIFVSEIEGKLTIGGFALNQAGLEIPVVLEC